MKFEDLTCCPFCGSKMYYEKQTAKGKIEFNSLFSGEEAPNYDMYEGLEHSCSGKCYCRDCNKYLGNKFKNIVGKEAEKKVFERNTSNENHKTGNDLK